MNLHQIGVVHSEIQQRKQMPRFGAPASLEIFPEFAAGLLHLEKHSHIWVFGWLNRAERDVLQVTPRGVSDRGPKGLHGVFAVRSPVRPNPIGLSAARILGLHGTVIDLDSLDFLDGTPVVDLKPYFVARDLIFSATNAPIGRPADRAGLRESLLFQAVNFHGELCGDLAIAVRILEHFRSQIPGFEEPTQWRVTAPLDRPCLIDALMGMTRVSLGRGTLVFGAPETVIVEPGHRYRILADPGREASGLLELADHSLFTPSAAS